MQSEYLKKKYLRVLLYISQNMLLITAVQTVDLLDRLLLLWHGHAFMIPVTREDNRDNSPDLGTLSVGRTIPPREQAFSSKLS